MSAKWRYRSGETTSVIESLRSRLPPNSIARLALETRMAHPSADGLEKLRSYDGGVPTAQTLALILTDGLVALEKIRLEVVDQMREGAGGAPVGYAASLPTLLQIETSITMLFSKVATLDEQISRPDDVHPSRKRR